MNFKTISAAACLVTAVAAGWMVSGCHSASATSEEPALTLRAPAYPLVTIDPYTSAWSAADSLNSDIVRHWTNKAYPLIGAVRIDGKVYRFMGVEQPVLETLVPTSKTGEWEGVYTTTAPEGEWWSVDYNTSSWKKGNAAFGSIPEEDLARTKWDTPDIWVRRTITLDEDLDGKPVYLQYSNDDDAEFFVNGVQVVRTGYNPAKEQNAALPADVVASLKKGENVIAAHCRNRGGSCFLDFGLDIAKDGTDVFTNKAKQISAVVEPMNTIYKFDCDDVELTVTFTAPLFLDNLDLVSRPVNYLTYEAKSKDGKKHDVDFYFEAGKEWAVNYRAQETESSVEELPGNLIAVTVANVEQNPLNRGGDDLRIDWGRFYMAADKANASAFLSDSFSTRKAFTGEASETQDGEYIGLTVDCGETKNATGYIMLAYDDVYSIQYFGDNLRPYWNRNNDTNIGEQIAVAARNYEKLMKESRKFDREMVKEAEEVGGTAYAELCALAYRQAITAHKLVEAPNGDLLWLSKENFSNGSIGTVDVTYPSAPMFLLYNPELVKGLLNHIFYYSESGKWTKPFPAHDVGKYPLANGMRYGADMPVEEGGNMIILCAALAQVEGNADYSAKHWDTLTTWVDYLAEFGLDPEEQLCTDDFAGHFAHNTNLSIKAIMAIASYARLAEMLGKHDVADKYMSMAKTMAVQWETMANDGDHYRLTFDKPDTWSQKYNLVWDRLLGFNIFPSQIVEKEIPYYLSKTNVYGVPLDNRQAYTKTDWIVWTATMAPDKATFEEFILPVYKFMNETEARVPMSDWTWTDKPAHRGFVARSVVGGYFIKMLEPVLLEKNK